LRLVELGSVLILAREDLVAALLGLMVELRGFQPAFLGASEAVAEGIERERPRVVVVDCDHPDCGEALLEVVRRAGAKPILFSPFRNQSEVREVAARHGVRSFTLPTDPDTFGQMLLEA
jgi:DNA-binding NtrC family response regulator